MLSKTNFLGELGYDQRSVHAFLFFLRQINTEQPIALRYVCLWGVGVVGEGRCKRWVGVALTQTSVSLKTAVEKNRYKPKLFFFF